MAVEHIMAAVRQRSVSAPRLRGAASRNLGEGGGRDG